jgi:3-hydroxyacyl-[acyl-carrier-protein] dehydratase
MRFLYYDSVSQIDKGKLIIGVKTFSLSEEFLRGHYTKMALVPGAIMIEAMAQLLGWLIGYSHDFSVRAIMSLIEDVTLPSRLRPGFKAEIHGEILSSSKQDSLGKAQIYVEGDLVASLGRIIYSHFPQDNPDDLAQQFRYCSGLRR